MSKCNKIKLGSNDCAYEIFLPWKCKFDWEKELERKPKCIAIDKCLLPEIIKLWELGIKTTGCCCGHGDYLKAFISVQEKYIMHMLYLGYTYHACANNFFIPKTELNYSFNKVGVI